MIRFIDQNGEKIALDIKQDGEAVGWVKPGRRTRFQIRTKCVGLRIEKIVLDHCEDWQVNDIAVHGRSQLAGHHYAMAPRPEEDGVPGVVFGAGLPSELTLETLQTAMIFTIDVTYKGANPEGQPLGFVAYGMAAY